MRARLARDVKFGRTTLRKGTEVEVLQLPGLIGDARIEYNGKSVVVHESALELLQESDPMPDSIRDLGPWVWRQGARMARYKMSGYRLSGRDSRFTKDEVREDVGIYIVNGAENIARFDALMAELSGGPLKEVDLLADTPWARDRG